MSKELSHHSSSVHRHTALIKYGYAIFCGIMIGLMMAGLLHERADSRFYSSVSFAVPVTIQQAGRASFAPGLSNLMCRVEQWSACLVHTQEVAGSNPAPATNYSANEPDQCAARPLLSVAAHCIQTSEVV